MYRIEVLVYRSFSFDYLEFIDSWRMLEVHPDRMYAHMKCAALAQINKGTVYRVIDDLDQSVSFTIKINLL